MWIILLNIKYHIMVYSECKKKERVAGLTTMCLLSGLFGVAKNSDKIYVWIVT